MLLNERRAGVCEIPCGFGVGKTGRWGKLKRCGVVVEVLRKNLDKARFVVFDNVGFELSSKAQGVAGVLGAVGISIKSPHVVGQRFVF